MENADAGDSRTAGLSRPRFPGALGGHGIAAARHTERTAVLPEREPLGAEAGRQRPVVRHRARLAESLGTLGVSGSPRRVLEPLYTLVPTTAKTSRYWVMSTGTSEG